MRSKIKIARNMLSVMAILLLLAYLYSCAANRKVGSVDSVRGNAGGVHETADSVEFVPLPPPVVVPHTWREEIKDQTTIKKELPNSATPFLTKFAANFAVNFREGQRKRGYIRV
ncbi:MAG: hypothetical protein J1E79_06215 [Rikenella sp.]|nr:hypothetical protein [Rikenella sp.]